MVRKMAYIGTFCFIGLFFASFFNSQLNFVISVSSFFISFLFLFLVNKKNMTGFICILTLSISFFLYGFYQTFVYNPILNYNGQIAEFSGKIQDINYSKGDMGTFILNGKINNKTSAKILYYGSVSDCEYGDKVTLKGKLTKLEDTYLFPSESYYKPKGIFLEASDVSINIKNNTSINPVKAILEYRDYLFSVIKNYLPKEEGEMLCTMAFGDKTGLDNSTKTLLFRSGIGHVMSVSGMHLAVISFILMWILKMISSKKWMNFVIIEISIILFCILAGLSVSVIRSAFMITLIFMADLFKRRADTFNSLGIAVVLLSITNPFIIRDSSFALSVVGVFGMGVVAPYFTEKIKFKGIFSGIKKSFLVMLCATIPILPVSVFFFDEVSIISPITNVILIPFCSIALVCAIVVAITGGIGFIATPFLLVAGICCKIVLLACKYLGNLSISHFSTGYNYILVFMFAASSILILCYFIFKDKKILSVTTSILCAVFILLNSVTGILNLKMLKIAVIGEKNASAIIISEGDSASIISLKNPQKNLKYVNKYLSKNGIDSVSVLYFTSNFQSGYSSYMKNLSVTKVNTILVSQDEYINYESMLNNSVLKKINLSDTILDFKNYKIIINDKDIYIKSKSFKFLATENANSNNNSFTIQYGGKENYSKNNYLNFNEMPENYYGYIITVDKNNTFKVRGIINGSRQ